jgi:DNA-binding transcriptional LysR family regulator
VRDGFDVVFSVGPLDDSSAKVRRLGTVGAGIYASARYLAEHGAPRRPSDLSKHACILHSRARKMTHWRLAGPNGATEVVVRGRITVDDLFTAMAAALNDGGLVVLPIHMASGDPAARALQRVLPDYEIRGEPTQLVYAASRHTPRRVTMFCDALMSHMQGTCPKG